MTCIDVAMTSKFPASNKDIYASYASQVGASGFADFHCERCPNPNLIWMHGSQREEGLLDRFAWTVSGNKKRGGDERRKFTAERYGGVGVGRNGGGARCAIEGSISIKGNGPNPLVDKGSPPGYSHGGMSTAECLQEAAWSTVLGKR